MTRYEQIKTELQASPKIWLVTGVAGFIGSNLLEHLLKLDQTVIGLDNFATGYQHNLDEVQSLVTAEQWTKFTFIEGDIRNYQDCEKALAHNVDYVLHQAALGSVPRSIADPLTTNAANITGFLNMLQASKEANVKSFTYAASSSTYGDHPALPKVEENIGNPLSPYAVTKYVNELYADVFGKTYNTDVIGLRYFNVFGPKQSPNGAYAAVIPLFMQALKDNNAPKINGDGEQTRDFTFVDNAVQANIRGFFAPKTASNQVFNVACGERISVNYLWDSLKNAANSNLEAEYGPERQGDVRDSLADISKAEKLMSYKPQFTVREGLKITWDYFVKHT